MLRDQAQALRKLMMETAPRRAQTVAIASGKGGVGKSNIAVNLSIRLAMMGRRVVLFDADLGTANADVLCDLRPAHTLAHVVAGRKSMKEVLVDAPGGFRLLAGASGLAKIASLSEFERARMLQQIDGIEDEADIILIDTGAGVSPNVLSFAKHADQLLVITTPEPTSVTDAYAVIKTVVRERPDADIRVLVNMVRDDSEALEVFQRIDAVCRKFLDLSLYYAGFVVHDPRVAQAVRRRTPFVLDAPNCEASKCVGKLAHRMDRHAAEPQGRGLLRRMTSWLAG